MVRMSFIALALGCMVATTLVAQEKKADKAPPKAQNVTLWFDMDHCPVCKCMASHKGLMESMVWETHLIDNGLVTVATVPADKKEVMAACEKEMHEVFAKLKSGDKASLCGFCDSYGKLVDAGAKVQEMNTGAGKISLVTSDKPEVVKQIQVHAKKTIQEYTALQDAAKKPNK